ncbi:MAG: hypothetical protein ACKPFA_05215, partial [Dolichospermum sp.]
PEILIVDEVLAVGDAQFQKKCLSRMGEVGNEGKTVLFVSHNMGSIQQLCESVLLLNHGNVQDFSKNVEAIVKKYFTNGESQESTQWVNVNNEFSNPWFKPLRFFIADKFGNERINPVSNDTDIIVQIEAEIEQSECDLTIGYAIYSDDNHLLYWSYQTDNLANNLTQSLTKGTCTLKSQIPRRFLNEGTYKIELIGGLHGRKWLFQPGINSPSIFLIIQGGLSDSLYWMVKRPGLIAPIMQWSISK